MGLNFFNIYNTWEIWKFSNVLPLCYSVLIKFFAAGSFCHHKPLQKKECFCRCAKNKIYKVSWSCKGRFNFSKISSSDSEEETWDSCVSWTWRNGMNLLASIFDLKFWKFDFIDVQVEAILDDCPLPILWFLSISGEEILEVPEFDILSFLGWFALKASYFLVRNSFLLLSRPSFLDNSE